MTRATAAPNWRRVAASGEPRQRGAWSEDLVDDVVEVACRGIIDTWKAAGED